MRTRFLEKLAVAVLLAASLSQPASVRAETEDFLPFDRSEELAPGFNACMKQAEPLYKPDVTPSEYLDAVLKCYLAAYKYWNDIFETEYENVVNDYCLLPRFRSAFEKYLSEYCNLVGGDGGFGLDFVCTRLYAEEKKRVVKMLRNHGRFEKPEEKPVKENKINSFSSQN